MPHFKVASGRSSLGLATKVCEHLGINVSATRARNFSDGELWVKFDENIRGEDLFIVQSTFSPTDNLMEILMLIDAARRASAKRITAVIPYYGYARQDRKDQPRVSITAKLVANLLVTAGADRIITLDLHSAQIQGYFDIPVDHMYASPVLLGALKKLGIENPSFASPDAGGVKTARSYAKRFGGGSGLIVVDKRRPEHNKAEIMNIIGEVKDKNVIIVDDMIDTGNTFIKCAEALKDQGAKSIVGVCVHPVFSGDSLKKFGESDAIDKLFVTDTIPLENKPDKLEVVSIAELLAEAIVRTHDNRSISSLFEIER